MQDLPPGTSVGFTRTGALPILGSEEWTSRHKEEVMHAIAIRGFAAVTLLAASFAATAQDGGALSSNTGIVTKASKYPVRETIDRVEAAAKGIGAHIFNRIDYQEMSKKVKVDVRPNELIIFGRGAGGPYIVKEAPLAGLDLPFKALAWEDTQGKVWVSYTTGTYVDQRYAIKGAAKYVKNIDETIGKLIAEALK
jgi:uncharacterized protein (DUF302 family)